MRTKRHIIRSLEGTEESKSGKEQGKRRNGLAYVSGVLFLVAAGMLLFTFCQNRRDDRRLEKQQENLLKEKEAASYAADTKQPAGQDMGPSEAETEKEPENTGGADKETAAIPEENAGEEAVMPVMLPEYQVLYEQNQDLIGWLFIEDTVINYPVMQTPEDEDYYLSYDFYGQENRNGCLILDTDSAAGIGTKEQAYQNGETPSTNLIIHGHTMKSGQMFGNLSRYEDEEYGRAHRMICFDSLYEKRQYELIAVFYSQVYYKSEQVFKYYKFFQADTKEEFDDWYDNIKRLSLYDTGVTAEFGDEFITLSCCAYHVEDGRFVVVGKRIE